MTENTNEELRIYVLVPETVQTEVTPWLPEDSHHIHQLAAFGLTPQKEVMNTKMVAGRLVAQGVHVGRKLGHQAASVNSDYTDITTIVLSVRNSKELTKVSKEVQHILHFLSDAVLYEEFHDTNPKLYGTCDKVHTITAFGPVTKAEMESAIGYLELY